ncbi:hypothetical protein SISNIDRAFT_545951 [Sistotremastrum niveocremeum HHB9708]|uniref:Uncharacterized protein n=2 Tax=Sistotremastraceae TaxID=3402574 RepID=A0A165AK27_9AGAM|nr:hypothetical protein SISNIDRAFT_545951 [Sistotremastrum niveocremeum HHB9708]KZT43977.1 hypothetical protein SISSUDRAFT_1124158 [Sistotremastrum suecicum HHB10207 ss-3]
MHDRLVAPRPVRISFPFPNIHRPVPTKFVSPSDNFRIKLEQDESDDPPRSPTTLPPETLEEFLSILRPSLVSAPLSSYRHYTTSPVLRAHRSRHSLHTIPSFPSIRSVQDGSPISVDSSLSTRAVGDASEGEQDDSLLRTETPSFQWRPGSVLASPISRSHTMNPFPRHRAFEARAADVELPNSPRHLLLALDSTPISPRLIPLPPSPAPSLA